jgi:hypothetical protein
MSQDNGGRINKLLESLNRLSHTKVPSDIGAIKVRDEGHHPRRLIAIE